MVYGTFKMQFLLFWYIAGLKVPGLNAAKQLDLARHTSLWVVKASESKAWVESG